MLPFQNPTNKNVFRKKCVVFHKSVSPWWGWACFGESSWYYPFFFHPRNTVCRVESVMLSSTDKTKLKTFPGFWFPHNKSHIFPCSPPRNHPSDSKCNPFYSIAVKSPALVRITDNPHGWNKPMVAKEMEISLWYPLFHTDWVRMWPFLGIWMGCPLQYLLLLHSLTFLSVKQEPQLLPSSVVCVEIHWCSYCHSQNLFKAESTF